MDALRGRPIEAINIPFSVDECFHAATATGAGRLSKCLVLRGEASSFVGRVRHPDAAVLFALHVGLRRMPGDIDVGLVVGGDRAAAVQTVSGVNHISLRLEGGAGVVQACVEQRDLGVRPLDRFVGSVPNDMDPAILANG